MAGLGIMDYLASLAQQGGGGILSGQPGASPQVAAPGQPTWMAGMSDFLKQNPALISNLASGIGSAPSMRMGIAKAAGGMSGAMAADQQTQQTAQEKAALGQYLGNPDTAKALSPAQLQFLKALPPDVAAKYAGQQIFPPTTAASGAWADYQHAKGEGSFTGTFVDWQKEYGTNRSAEDWGLLPQPVTDQAGNVTNLVRMSNRGGIQFMDEKFNVLKTYHPGDPDYAAASTAAQSSGAAPPTSASASAGAPAGPTSQPVVPAGSAYRPPGASKVVGQGTQSTIIGPTGVPQTTLPIYNTQETADKSAGTAQAGDLQTVNNASIKATTQKNSIALMRRAASDPNFYSGALADQVLAVKKLGVALGMDKDTAASMENFQSMSNQLVKDRLGSLGTGVSNADVGFISRTVPTLEATPQGNQQLLDILDKLADRDIEVGKVAQEYAAKSGGGTRLDANWPTYLAQWAASHPLFAGGGGSSGGQPSVDDLVKKYAP